MVELCELEPRRSEGPSEDDGWRIVRFLYVRVKLFVPSASCLTADQSDMSSSGLAARRSDPGTANYMRATLTVR